MGFSVVSWNVEFFGSNRPGESDAQVEARIERVFDFLRSDRIAADVFAIYEVNGGQVFEPARAAFPDHQWAISEGGGSQRILVGSRIQGTFVTHRAEFSQGFAGPLRPGMLVTVPDGGTDYPILFLHLKAADVPVDFGVRAHQHDKVRSLRKALDNAAGGRANFVVAGDFNSVGLGLTYSAADITGDDENLRLVTMYDSSFDLMPIRSKNHRATFWNGPGSRHGPVDIDHVAAATSVTFESVDGADVEVIGWPELATDDEKRDWIEAFSDHALLRFTVA